MRNVRDLLDLSIDEDYYKPTIARVLLIAPILNMK